MNRKIFSVLVDEKEYDVYDLQGKEHEGYNDTPKTWWMYYSNKLPEGTEPPIDSPHWFPWQYASSIQRRAWRIEVTQKNHVKVKWDSPQFRSTTWVDMWCNNRLVYSFAAGGSGMNYALSKVQVLQVEMSEHPFNFFEPETENGRKIYFHGLPATVKIGSVEQWEITIVPDYTVGISEQEWWSLYASRTAKLGDKKQSVIEDMESENEDIAEWRDYGHIHWGSALSDQHIDWFR